jgi:hypothetical protein
VDRKVKNYKNYFKMIDMIKNNSGATDISSP